MSCVNYIELEFATNNIFTLPSPTFKKKIYVAGVTPSMVAEGENLKYVGGYFRKNNNFRLSLDVKTLGFANIDKDSDCCDMCQDYGDYLELSNLIKNYKYMRILSAVLPRQNATPCLLYTSDAADERSSVDLGGRRILKKKTTQKKKKNKIELSLNYKKRTPSKYSIHYAISIIKY